GNLNVGGQPSFKHDDLDLAQWYRHQMKKYKVDVLLNTKATKEILVNMRPDAVFVAEGSRPVVPPIEGADGKNVYLAEEVLSGKVETGAKNVIIGGGLVGCELALHLVKDQGKQATIVEALPALLMSGSPLPPMNYWMLTDLLNFHQVGQIT